MSVAGGLNSQLGLKPEVTVGTALTVDRFMEFESESLKLEIDRIEHSGLRPTRRVIGANNWQEGQRRVTGDIQKMVQNKGDAILFKHMLGSATTTTPSGATLARQHLCKVGALDGLGFTIQVGRTDNGGTTRAFTYSGCKVASWELSNTVNEMLALSLTIDGMDETTATALATASYPTSLADFSYLKGVVKLDTVEFEVKDWSLTGDNGLATDRYFIRSSSPGKKKEQLEGAGMREYGGSLTAEFTDLAAYTRFVNGTPAALNIVYTGGSIESGQAYTVTIDCPYIRFDGETPNVGGPELLDLSLPFKVLDNADTNGPVVITVINTDTAA